MPLPISTREYAGLRALVVGAGRTGVSVARFLHAAGARVVLTDGKPLAALAESGGLGELPPGVGLELGGLRAASFRGADLVVLSPGVPPTLPEIAAAHKSGVRLTGEVELAARHIAAPIVAITGTNGKSTVTSLCGDIARATGRPTFVGGNLGTPLVEAIGTPAAEAGGIVVCECSSYQLETTERFHPRAAVLLNITPDHLDRHGTMVAYAEAKLRIAGNLGPGDIYVWNEDDEEAAAATARHVSAFVPRTSYSTRTRPAHRRTISTSAGPRALDLGGFVDGPGDGLVDGLVDGEALVLRLAPEATDAASPPAVIEERYPTEGMHLIGRHNLGNALAAFLAMRQSGLASPEAVLAGARAFRPLPHRMELAGEKRGVRYYDDSKGTNVAAVVASLDGFPRPFVLIAGGKDKGGSYAPLAEALGRNTVRAVVVIGEAASLIADAVGPVAAVHHAGSMDAAVRLGASLSREGDAVILSPACSSFDMFRDYKDRGHAFCAAVEALP